MSKFKEGQYVKYRLEGVGPIYRVYGYSGEKIVMLEKSVEGVHFTGEAHEDALRLARNIDYIRTLPTEQMARVLLLRPKGRCDLCYIGYSVNGCVWECKWGDICRHGVLKWLQKPYDGWRVE